MDRLTFIKKISKQLEELTSRIDYWDFKKRAVLETGAANVVKVTDYLFNEVGLRLVTATALETGDELEIYYHFSNDTNGLILNVLTRIPVIDPSIDSITNVCPAADWIEREMHELYGIDFKDHPNLAPLISEGNWETGVFPFRKQNGKQPKTPVQ